VLGLGRQCAVGQTLTPSAPATTGPGVTGRAAPDPAPCATLPFLADSAPSRAGATDPGGGGSVVLSASAVGLQGPGVAWAGDLGAAWTSGTFLVRRMFRPPCDPAAPTGGFRCDQLFALRSQVVARIDPATAVRVTVP
jgi:hypothetical protein